MKAFQKNNVKLTHLAHLVFFVLIPAFSSTSFAACYTVYDKSDKPVYKSSEPPFDLSIPISESIKSKYPGGYLIQTENRICHLPKKTDSAGISGNAERKKRDAPSADIWRTPSGYIGRGSPDWANRATISPKIYGPDGSEDVAAPAPAPVSQRSDGALCPFTLASQPQSSGNPDSRAQLLDDLEARLYRDARSGQISWVQLVDKFYSQCAALYQGYYNENYRELPAYQRVLAEKMDARSIKESEWIYLIETKLTEIKALDHEIRTRNQLIENTRPSPSRTNCTTFGSGSTYHTSCY